MMGRVHFRDLALRHSCPSSAGQVPVARDLLRPPEDSPGDSLGVGCERFIVFDPSPSCHERLVDIPALLGPLLRNERDLVRDTRQYQLDVPDFQQLSRMVEHFG